MSVSYDCGWEHSWFLSPTREPLRIPPGKSIVKKSAYGCSVTYEEDEMCVNKVGDDVESHRGNSCISDHFSYVNYYDKCIEVNISL